MGDSGLSQEDFRKLLQTPRAAPNDSETTEKATPRFKAPAPKAPRNTGAVFATPQALRKKKPQKPASATPSNYRDRAAERRNNEQQEELSTEELLQKTTREEDETLDAKQLYEQSKYLGGDVDHTHLVKGLDYSLLEKVRNDIGTKLADAKSEAALDHALDRLGQGGGSAVIIDDEQEQEDDEEEVERIPVRSVMAKNLVRLVTTPKPTTNELFTPGRMAFVFELADEVGHYTDAFALPTTVIRSKADVIRKRTDTQAETELVIRKISQIMRPSPPEPSATATKKKEDKKKKPEPIVQAPPQPVDSDDDIFSDAGTDYELDEETMENERKNEKEKSIQTTRNYFKREPGEEEEEEEEEDQMQEVTKLLSQATNNDHNPIQQQEDEQLEQPTKRRKFDQEEEDADAMDIDMYGLGTSALPTSFEDRQRTVAYDSDGDDDEEDDRKATSLVDQGTNRNKKAQLTRWDFDDEEQWQKYKDTVEIHPKSAFQYGVKLGDGRKRNREQRRGMSDKQKLNREYQMVKNIMDKKYGK